jgi:hypothetical protein
VVGPRSALRAAHHLCAATAPLVREALAQSPSQSLHRRVGIISVVAGALTGQDDVKEVVVPLGVVEAAQIGGVVRLGLQYEVHVAVASWSLAHALGELDEEVSLRCVVDSVHRDEPQAVDVVLLEPVQGVVDKELAYVFAALAVEVDRGSLWVS